MSISSQADLNRHRWIQSPKCSPVQYGSTIENSSLRPSYSRAPFRVRGTRRNAGTGDEAQGIPMSVGLQARRAILFSIERNNDSSGACTHALTSWRLKPAPRTTRQCCLLNQFGTVDVHSVSRRGDTEAIRTLAGMAQGCRRPFPAHYPALPGTSLGNPQSAPPTPRKAPELL